MVIYAFQEGYMMSRLTLVRKVTLNILLKTNVAGENIFPLNLLVSCMIIKGKPLNGY